MRIFFLVVFVGVFSVVFASLGTLEQFRGDVKVKHSGSIMKEKVSIGMKILAGDLIVTSAKSVANISLRDGSDIVLDKDSTILFQSNTKIEQEKGKIYYKISSRNAKNSLKIKTSFAIIGIKGTTFIINSTNTKSVSLKEGHIGIESVKKEFELYKLKVENEFKKYQLSQTKAFNQYKKKQTNYIYVKTTKEFDIKSENRVSFLGNRVNEEKWNSKDDKEFENFEQLIKTMK